MHILALGVWDWIVGILLFALGIGFLIALHELGHLIAAKIFKVYCAEYSIGFGPKLFSIKPKKAETKFSLRAIPLGGYVAMYGEDAKDEEEFKDIPPERSLEGIKKWKRAIIFVAGVLVNFLIGTLLLLTSNLAFPQYTNAKYINASGDNVYHLVVNFDESSPLLTLDLSLKNDGTDYIDLFRVTNSKYGTYYIIDDDISIPNQPTKYVLVTSPLYRTTSTPIFSSSIAFYKQSDKTLSLISNGEAYDLNEIHYPDLDAGAYSPNAIEDIEITLRFHHKEEGHHLVNFTLQTIESGDKYAYKDVGMKYAIKSYYLNFGEAFVESFRQFGVLFVEILKAIGGLFTGQFANVGGIVAIAGEITKVNAYYGFGMFLFYLGYISINLGIFNLIPFPGLDGWSLLVLIVEAISRKKIPQKAKGIISFVGLILLFGLMIFILVKDIVGLVI